MLLRSPFDMMRSNPQALLGVGSTRAPASTKKFVGFNSCEHDGECVRERERKRGRRRKWKTHRLRVLVIVQNAILQLEPAGPPVLDVITLLGEPAFLGGVLGLLSSQTLTYSGTIAHRQEESKKRKTGRRY